jgi:hypothetical protein
MGPDFVVSFQDVAQVRFRPPAPKTQIAERTSPEFMMDGSRSRKADFERVSTMAVGHASRI